MQQEQHGLAICEGVALDMVGMVVPFKAEFLPQTVLMLWSERLEGLPFGLEGGKFVEGGIHDVGREKCSCAPLGRWSSWGSCSQGIGHENGLSPGLYSSGPLGRLDIGEASVSLKGLKITAQG